MNLDAVVGVLVAIFACKPFCKGGAGVGKLVVKLHFLTLFRGERTLAGYIFVSLVKVDITRGLVKKAARCVEFGFHYRKDFAHCGEFDDGFAKLLAILCIGFGFTICDFAYADALCGDAEAGAVHKGHHIFDKAETA